MAIPDEDKISFIESLSPNLRTALNEILTPVQSKYTPKVNIDGKPFELNPKQRLACLMDTRVLLMHGSGGGGKSIALLYMALQYADQKKYSGLILMRTLKSLEQLIANSRDWLDGTGSIYNKVDKLWTFPEGGTLKFGYLDAEDDVYQYRGQEYQYIGFDELTRFKTEDMFTYLFSRLRKPAWMNIPLRVRAATNPGDIGATWVYNFFINPETCRENTAHIQMHYGDNKYLDKEEYELSLSSMSSIERARMQFGDWDIADSNQMINHKWFKYANGVNYSAKQRVRVWDMAASKTSAKDPDFTAGALCSYHDGIFTVEDIQHFRGSPFDVEKRILATYEADAGKFGTEIQTFIELGNNSGSKHAIDLLLRGPFAGTNIRAISSNVPKEERARPFAVSAENGYVVLVEGQWNKAMIDECKTFPNPKFHDDCIDAVVYAFTHLVVNSRRYKSRVTSFSRPSGRTDLQRLTVLRAR